MMKLSFFRGLCVYYTQHCTIFGFQESRKEFVWSNHSQRVLANKIQQSNCTPMEYGIWRRQSLLHVKQWTASWIINSTGEPQVCVRESIFCFQSRLILPLGLEQLRQSQRDLSLGIPLSAVYIPDNTLRMTHPLGAIFVKNNNEQIPLTLKTVLTSWRLNEK